MGIRADRAEPGFVAGAVRRGDRAARVEPAAGRHARGSWVIIRIPGPPARSASGKVKMPIRTGALSQLVAAACQGGGLGGVARQLYGFVARCARLLTAAQSAQQVGAGRMVGVIAGQPVLETVDSRQAPALGGTPSAAHRSTAAANASAAASSAMSRSPKRLVREATTRAPSRAAAHPCYERPCLDPTPSPGYLSSRFGRGMLADRPHRARQCADLPRRGGGWTVSDHADRHGDTILVGAGRAIDVMAGPVQPTPRSGARLVQQGNIPAGSHRLVHEGSSASFSAMRSWKLLRASTAAMSSATRVIG